MDGLFQLLGGFAPAAAVTIVLVTVSAVTAVAVASFSRRIPRGAG